jgi:chemotaxis protein CheD
MNIFMKPGEIYVSEEPAVVSTILGSCIAVTIFSERLKIGGICHALLPKSPSTNGHDRFRYVDSAICYMLNRFEIMGVKKDEMEVKLLGGADILEHIDGNTTSVGQKNIEAALGIMKGKNIKLSTSDVGGKLGRKIRFYTNTGQVLLKRIKRVPGEECP